MIGPVQAGLTAIAWLVAAAWWTAPQLSTVAVDWQWSAWIPDWAWLIGVAGCGLPAMLLIPWSGSGRMVRLVLTLAAFAGPLRGVALRDVGWGGASPDPRVRIVFLNAQSPSEPDAATDIGSIEALDPDLVLVANPGWIAPTWRAMTAARRDAGEPGVWTIRWRSPVMAASMAGACSLRTLVADGEIRVVRVGLPESLAARLGRTHVVVVDLPSDPELDREAVADRLLAGLEKIEAGPLDRHGLVLGDFNMTPRTPALVRLRGGLRDLVSESGSGWTATWPRDRPLLRIDQVLGDVPNGVRIETFDPGAGGHLGFVIDLPVAAAGAEP